MVLLKGNWAGTQGEKKESRLLWIFLPLYITMGQNCPDNLFSDMLYPHDIAFFSALPHPWDRLKLCTGLIVIFPPFPTQSKDNFKG